MNDMTDAFFKKKKPLRPFLYLSPSAQNISLISLCLLSLQVLMLALTKSWGSLIVIGASLSGFIGADLLHAKLVSSSRFSLVSAIFQGTVTGMLLPSTFHPVTVFCIAFSTMFLIKYLSGNFADHWINSAVLAVAFAWIVGMSAFPENPLTKDILQIKNPSHILIQNGVFPIMNGDRSVTEALNNTIFGFANISIPEGYISLLWDTHSIIPAFRFNALTLLASVVLFASGMQGLLIPASFAAVYTLLVRFVSPVFTGAMAGQGDMILSLCTGGTLFCAVFVVQQYGTVPLSKRGKILYGILAGIFAFAIAGCGTSSAGMIFAVLCANIVSPLIQAAEDRRDASRLRAMLSSLRREKDTR
ncbi:RnfABCDGE type electron transport complex subunit D [Treponema socranskii subsp. buccale]|uniref:RnfABCDGE type electron transport complex subunit D n=1 Tax=Treponema socranskii TaxID=53419 RepID=UPI0020A3F952|nr:RnfABCDGE type electron transport complex subunit D [Treponema socranskii]UTD02730.1 RnfABCDGE type electron transport complex subunit D [Treponema socranskii subsp. buccale]